MHVESRTLLSVVVVAALLLGSTGALLIVPGEPGSPGSPLAKAPPREGPTPSARSGVPMASREVGLGPREPLFEGAGRGSEPPDPLALTVGPVRATSNPDPLGEPVTFSGSVTGGDPPYQVLWKGLPPGCPGNANLSETCTPSVTGNFTIVLSVHDAAGTSANSTSLLFSVTFDAARAVAQVLVDPGSTRLAPGDEGEFSAVAENSSGGTVPANFSWSSTVPGATLTNLTGSATALLALLDGAGFLSVRATGGGESAQGQAYVQVTGTTLKVLAFNATPSSAPLGVAVNLSLLVVGGSSPYSILYSGLPPPCSTLDESYLTCAPGSVGGYTVEVTVHDAHGAVRSANVSFSVTAAATRAPMFAENPWLLALLGVGGVAAVLLLGAWVLRPGGRWGREPPLLDTVVEPEEPEPSPPT